MPLNHHSNENVEKDNECDHSLTNASTENGDETPSNLTTLRWTPEEERQIMRKVDIRVFPMLGILLGLSLLERVNVSAAYIAGMAQDLNLEAGSRYSTVLLVFFIGYAIFDIPSNMAVRRFGSRRWLSFLVVVCGTICMCMGLVRSWVALAGLRALLGVFEAGILPGAILVVSSWYRPYELATRVSLFWLFSQVIAAFGPILAYALSRISVGSGVYAAGWRWIFIVEGLVTALVGLTSSFILIDFPERAKFLTDREKFIALYRLRSEEDSGAHLISIRNEMIGVVTDWRVILIAINYFIASSSVYSVSYFTPIILRRGLHFSSAKALLLSSPPSLISAMLCVVAAVTSDKIRLRWPIMIGQACAAIAGLLIILYARPPGVRYFGLFVTSYGVQSNLLALLSYLSNQVATAQRKGIATGFVISFGALGGICGSTIFRSQDAPRYLPGIWSTVAMLMVFIVIMIVLTLHFRRTNRLLDEGKVEKLEKVEGFRYVP